MVVYLLKSTTGGGVPEHPKATYLSGDNMQTLEEYLAKAPKAGQTWKERKQKLKKESSRRKKVYATYKEKRSALIKSLGDKCVDCGYTYNDSQYDFHHRNPDDKKFSLAAPQFWRKDDIIKKEAAKCDLLCKNCHAARHIK
jgi:oligoribonuclease NrnB/cAMP/cGMP phosphodiesterase (DHH superfamily)